MVLASRACSDAAVAFLTISGCTKYILWQIDEPTSRRFVIYYLETGQTMRLCQLGIDEAQADQVWWLGRNQLAYTTTGSGMFRVAQLGVPITPNTRQIYIGEAAKQTYKATVATLICNKHTMVNIRLGTSTRRFCFNHEFKVEFADRSKASGLHFIVRGKFRSGQTASTYRRLGISVSGILGGTIHAVELESIDLTADQLNKACYSVVWKCPMFGKYIGTEKHVSQAETMAFRRLS